MPIPQELFLLWMGILPSYKFIKRTFARGLAYNLKSLTANLSAVGRILLDRITDLLLDKDLNHKLGSLTRDRETINVPRCFCVTI